MRIASLREQPQEALANDQQALDQVYSLAYEELRRLARAVLRSDRSATLTPTTLVNEAWMKLARSPEVAHTSPLHFRRIAARAMRQVMVEAARRKRSQIRGGGQPHVAFDESLGVIAPMKELGALLTLDAALSALGKIAPRQAQRVEERFFGGLSWVEAAQALGISEATVMRAWLAWHMKHSDAP